MRLGFWFSGAVLSSVIVACSGGEQTLGPMPGSGAASSSGTAHGSSGASGSGSGGSLGGGSGGGSGGAGSSSGGSSGGGASSGGGSNGGGSNGGGSSGSGGSSDAGAKPSDAGGGPAPDASPPNDGFDPFQHRNLDDVNNYRATLHLAPLVLDKQLSDFALAGAQELSQDHQAHQHFINASNDGTLWSSGFKNSAAENQGDPNGWYEMSKDPVQNELLQIDDIQKSMFDEGPGTGEAHGHYENIMDPKSTRLGVGLLEVGGQLYLTNDFSQ